MDFPQSLLALGVLLPPLLAAIAIGLWGSRLRSARVRGLMTASALLSFAAALAGFWRSDSVDIETPLLLGRWLSVGPADDLGIAISFLLDGRAAALAAVMSLAAACVIPIHSPAAVDGRSVRGFYAGAALLVFASLAAVLSMNLGAFLVFWQVGGVAAYWMLSAGSDDANSARLAKKFFLVQRVADVPLLCMVFALGFGFQSLSIDQLFGAGGLWFQGEQARVVLTEFLGLCVLGACAARCALFPLFGWLDPLAETPAVTAALIEAICFMPCGVVLIERCLPVWNSAAASASLATLLGAASAFFLAVSACAAVDRRRCLGLACASIYGLMVFALAAHLPTAKQAAFGLLTVFIPAAATLLSVFSIGPSQGGVAIANPARASGTMGGRFGWERWIAVPAIFVLFTGIFGQGEIVRAAWQHLQADWPHRGGATLLSFVLAAAAEFYAGLAIVRGFQGATRPQADEDHRTIIVMPSHRPALEAAGRWSRVAPLAILSCGALVIGLWEICGMQMFAMALGVRFGEIMRDRAADLAGSIPALAGLGLGVLRARSSSIDHETRSSRGLLMRLGRHRFYCDGLILAFIVLPLRASAQFARFFDWAMIDHMIFGMPASLAQTGADLFEPTERRSPAFYALAAGMSAVCLAAAIVWLRG